jgi:hypothetical protein
MAAPAPAEPGGGDDTAADAVPVAAVAALLMDLRSFLEADRALMTTSPSLLAMATAARTYRDRQR